VEAHKMGSTGWPIKYVRMHPDRRRRFEAVCKALGLREYEVIDQILAKWIHENEQQARISSFLPEQREFTFLVDRVNIVAGNVKLAVIKKDFSRILDSLEEDLARNRLDHVEGKRDALRNFLEKATKLPIETRRDPELQALVARAEKNLA
jgi:hypothetical protein